MSALAQKQIWHPLKTNGLRGPGSNLPEALITTLAPRPSALRARVARLFQAYPTEPILILLPIFFLGAVCWVVWLLTLSLEDLGAALLGSCLLLILSSSSALYLQRFSQGRPYPEKNASHNWLQARAIAWSTFASAAAGVILVVTRLDSALGGQLVPTAEFPVTEIVVLGLTIGVLAVLTRYSATAAYVESNRVSSELTAVVREVRTSVDELRQSIGQLTSEVSRLNASQNPRPRIHAALVHAVPSKKQHSILIRVSVSGAKARTVVITPTIDQSPRAALSFGDLERGVVAERALTTGELLNPAGEIGLRVSWSDERAQSYVEDVGFAYTVTKGFFGAIKAINLTPI